MSQHSFIPSIPHLPDPERARLSEALEQAPPNVLARLRELMDEQRYDQWARVLVGSPFTSEWLVRHPEAFVTLLTRLQANAPLALPTLDGLAEAEFDQTLRQVRNQTQVEIIWRDLNRLHTLEQTTAWLTELAEWALQKALHHHYQALCDELGTPTDTQGQAQPLMILGLGKLGAWELNLSSDVDLMFAYPSGGQTVGGRKALSNQEFFTRLGQRVIKSLDATTLDGFVFRVDMRLRPYGTAGALASSFDALEDYYQTQGREWERFAMIKARIVATNGSQQACAQLSDLLRSFTYRKYVDYSAIDALRNLKQMINREVARRRLSHNIKIGRGGIREVEFIAQAFQIIRGGRDSELQERRVLKVLPMLEAMHCLPAGTVAPLMDAYRFLRKLAHAIQAYGDEQTQNLPSDEGVRSRLASALGFDDFEALSEALDAHRKVVSEQFQAVIAEPENPTSKADDAELKPWDTLWHDVQAPSTEAEELLSKAGFLEADNIAEAITTFINSPRVMAMDAPSRERLNAFMPRLLRALSDQGEALQTLQRLIGLLNAVVRRSAYLLLLTENPGALNQLLVLVAGSPWIAKELEAHPALLDELLDPATLYHVPSKADLEHELRQYLLRIPADDLEQQMEGLRYFRSAHALRVAACEITDRLPLMRVSDYLTELAEVILGYVLQLAWAEMVARYGYPDGEVTQTPPFIIVGYGKLGGIELGHGSDLDLVFIHRGDASGQTNGDAEGNRVIDNPTFFMRLGQKIIHILNTQTLGGQLYEVDMRLRPSGNSGLLVASFTAFEKYQFNDAWTWEHQALVRARPIAGDAELAAQFEALRTRVLTLGRDTHTLLQDVVEMRKKMRSQLGSSKSESSQGKFALKQDAGGIVDIEFMVQYAVLAWSHAHPSLAHYTDNIRILEGLAALGTLPTHEVHQLIEAYKVFRAMGHRLALQRVPAVVEASTVEAERQAVQAIWARVMAAD